MLNTILFDLDGTLLDLDLDFFMEQYFKALVPKMAHLIPPQKFLPDLIAATVTMMKNTNPQRTNQEVFIEDFQLRVSYTEEQLMPLFADFYQNEFAELKQFTKCNNLAKKVVQKAIDKGYEVAVATQPVFPYQAIKYRLDWAGVGDLPFKLITSYEQSHFCKPNTAYFKEILDKLNRQPEECLMVGNDVDDDLPAGDLGIRTYLLTDCLLNRRGRTDYRTDYTGCMEDLYKFVDDLPRLFNK